MSRHVSVTVNMIELVDADVDHPREITQAKFLEKGYVVTNWEELKYFFRRNNQGQYYFYIEGNIGLSLLKR